MGNESSGYEKPALVYPNDKKFVPVKVYGQG
jgi:hypothetical protein